MPAARSGTAAIAARNASDAYDANENDRPKVRTFMRALGQIARECNAGVLLLAHVDKGTSRGERSGSEGYSGSTAWNNSARSRLYLRREADGTLVIEQQKNNLGKLHQPIRLEWPENGIPQLAEPFGPYAEAEAERAHEKALLKLIAEYSARGEHITTAIPLRVHSDA